MVKHKPILSPKKLVQDLVSGATIDEALAVPTVAINNDNKGGLNMDYTTALQGFIGQPVVIHTVTYAFAGRLASVDGALLTLEDATWIADLGEIGKTFRSGKFTEADHVGQCFVINATAVVYVTGIPEMPTVGKGK